MAVVDAAADSIAFDDLDAHLGCGFNLIGCVLDGRGGNSDSA